MIIPLIFRKEFFLSIQQTSCVRGMRPCRRQTFEERMIETQAEKITELNNVIRLMNAEIRAMRGEEFYWKELAKICKDDGMIADEWKRFIAVLTLAYPDISGLTRA